MGHHQLPEEAMADNSLLLKGYSHTADPQAPRETWELLDHPLQVTANLSACSTKRPQHIKA